MGFCETFMINSNDYAAYMNKYGLVIDYMPVTIQADKYTMDGVLHSKDLTNKAVYRIKMNPVPEDILTAILSDYRAASVTLTITDPNAETDRTISCKTSPVSAAPAVVQNAEITYWQLGDLTFTEK